MKDAFGEILEEGMTVIHSMKTSDGIQYSIAKIIKIISSIKHKIELKIIKSTNKDKNKKNIVVFAYNVMKLFDV